MKNFLFRDAGTSTLPFHMNAFGLLYLILIQGQLFPLSSLIYEEGQIDNLVYATTVVVHQQQANQLYGKSGGDEPSLDPVIKHRQGKPYPLTQNAISSDVWNLRLPALSNTVRPQASRAPPAQS